ncbi:MAG: hypothetical protein ACI4EF_07270 [Coprococcus sp.]
MYKIDETKFNEKYILLIPAMLDAHFPLLKFAFFSKDYHPVILDNEDNIQNIGLKYVNHDMCYPAILNVGQIIGALQSGKYDLNRTVLLMPQAGDACRGSNYIYVLRRSVEAAGFSVPTLSLNALGMEKETQLKLRPYMVWRALIAVVYGDLLMILKNQIKPYEKEPGATQKMEDFWLSTLSNDLKNGKKIGLISLNKRMKEIVHAYHDIPIQKRECKKVGIVGELFVKYCHLGNHNLLSFLENEGCEYYVNGLLWYVLYYIDSHFDQEHFLMKKAYHTAFTFIAKIQKTMINILRENGFYVMDDFIQFKHQASAYVNFNSNAGDGWLIGAEVVAHAKGGYNRILGVQPFGCMPNQINGRGLYPSLSRKLNNIHLSSIDFDPGASDLNINNRIKMVLDIPLKQ